MRSVRSLPVRWRLQRRWRLPRLARSMCHSSVGEKDDGSSNPFTVVAIDRSGLLGERDREAAAGRGMSAVGAAEEANHEQQRHKTKETPLLEEIKSHLLTRGPLSVAEYMQMCLGHPEFGYYQQREVFGRRGDFITSPEITQIFGELIGIWLLLTWSQCGKPDPAHLVELGPGRGTLMQDILTTVKAYPEFLESGTVHLVENSVLMREIQRRTLKVSLDTDDTAEDSDLTSMARERVKGKNEDGVNVEWHWGLDTLPQDAPLFCVAHEFFDAIPVHQFQHTDRGWCEVLVDSEFDDAKPNHLRFVLAPCPGPSSSAFLGLSSDRRRELYNTIPQILRISDESPSISESASNGQLPGGGSGGVIMPETATNRDGVPLEADQGIPIGARLEVGPIRQVMMESLCNRIHNQGGASLIIDYGEDHPQQVTLQGVKDHKFADVLETPGEVDLSAHVDFRALRAAARHASDKLQVFPLIPQGAFLLNMAIEARMKALCDKAHTPEQKEAIEKTVMRLVSEEQMGLLFKVLAVTQPHIGAPAGFPEDADTT